MIIYAVQSAYQHDNKKRAYYMTTERPERAVARARSLAKAQHRRFYVVIYRPNIDVFRWGTEMHVPGDKYHVHYTAAGHTLTDADGPWDRWQEEKTARNNRFADENVQASWVTKI